MKFENFLYKGNISELKILERQETGQLETGGVQIVGTSQRIMFSQIRGKDELHKIWDIDQIK